MSRIHFSKGDRVEIKRSSSSSPSPPNVQWSDGGYYSATVLYTPARTKAPILVEYDRVTSSSSSSIPSLCEYVPVSMARPAPPGDLHRRFKVGESIEAYDGGGWHQGVVREAFDDHSMYLVRLEGSDREVKFAQSSLRLRREWTDRGWDPPFPRRHHLQKKSLPRMKLRPRSVHGFKITSYKKKSVGSTRPFGNGKVVEVSINEEGFEGAWYAAVIKDYLGDDNYLVEYLFLMTDDKAAPLREEVCLDDLRPYPPRQGPPPVLFRPLDMVDVWYNDGWWTGVISKVLRRSTFVVYFSTTNEELVFKEPYVRIHQDWIDQKWVFSSQDTLYHLGPRLDNLEWKVDSDDHITSKGYFCKGMKVEARSNKISLMGSWYTAVILDSTGEERYMIEYKTLKTDDETGLLREEVNASQVRPYPPDVQRVYGFSRLELVDAWYNEGWWIGHVSDILKGSSNYQVYFRSTDNEMVFNHSDLRPHKEWIGGQWIDCLKDHITV
ncbi:hypothetical protein SAY87_009288 [Trapa incisa]|uniref:Agenet domain-containing protein n=1 Tax=Trapa incisa TaxID=236973 RepID=A0AAN7JXI5_9MYRT|nr:hypothetical protein SAY87_009288 [Trapa incisa]